MSRRGVAQATRRVTSEKYDACRTSRFSISMYRRTFASVGLTMAMLRASSSACLNLSNATSSGAFRGGAGVGAAGGGWDAAALTGAGGSSGSGSS